MGHTYIKKIVHYLSEFELELGDLYIYFLLNQATLSSSHTFKIGGLDSMASKAGTLLDKADWITPYLSVIPALPWVMVWAWTSSKLHL